MPRFRFITLALFMIALATAASVGCKARGGLGEVRSGRTVPMTVLRSASGSDAAVCTAGEWLINSDEALAALGSSQLNDLGVDFVTESLVVITLGEQPTGGFWLRIDGVSRGDRGLYVHGVANRPGDEASQVQMVTCPFAAVVIEKTISAVIRPEIRSVQGVEQ